MPDIEVVVNRAGFNSDAIGVGPPGPPGPDGKSAYQIAVDLGFEGTEEEWLASVEGVEGPPGPPGKTAYEVAVDEGFPGSEQDWLDSLVGGPGPPGPGGSTVLSGVSVPQPETGTDGDFYVWFETPIAVWLYGPKTAGEWGASVSLVGPQGLPGDPGDDGTDGVDGNTILAGVTAPASELGVDGDFYIHTETWDIYGPKTSGSWGAATSLIGPQGVPGESGETIGEPFILDVEGTAVFDVSEHEDTQLVVIYSAEQVPYRVPEKVYAFNSRVRGWLDQVWFAVIGTGFSGETEPEWFGSVVDGEIYWELFDLWNGTGQWTAETLNPDRHVIVADGSVWLLNNWYWDGETSGTVEPDWGSYGYGEPVADGDLVWLRTGVYSGAWQPDTKYSLKTFFTELGSPAGDAVDADAGRVAVMTWGYGQEGASGSDGSVDWPDFSDTGYGFVLDGEILWATQTGFDSEIYRQPLIKLSHPVEAGKTLRFTATTDVYFTRDSESNPSEWLKLDGSQDHPWGQGVTFVSIESDEENEYRWRIVHPRGGGNINSVSGVDGETIVDGTTDITVGLDSDIVAKLDTLVLEPVFDDDTLVGVTLPVSLSLNDFMLYLRNYGDPNHSLSWGFPSHSIDGPVLNGFGGGGLAAGSVEDSEDVVALRWDESGVEILDGNGDLVPAVATTDIRLDAATTVLFGEGEPESVPDTKSVYLDIVTWDFYEWVPGEPGEWVMRAPGAMQLPEPGSYDSGKAVVVNATEDGFELGDFDPLGAADLVADELNETIDSVSKSTVDGRNDINAYAAALARATRKVPSIIVQTPEERDEQSAPYWPDGSVGFIEVGEQKVTVAANSSSVAKATWNISERPNIYDSATVGGLESGVSYVGGGPIYDAGGGVLYLIYHGEKTSNPTHTYWSFLGLAKSLDNGETWTHVTRIIEPEATENDIDGEPLAAEVGGGPYVVVGGYMYVYFQDWNPALEPTGVSVARCLLEDIEDSGEWFKWDGATWTEPGLGGESVSLVSADRPYDDLWFDAVRGGDTIVLLSTWTTHLDAGRGIRHCVADISDPTVFTEWVDDLTPRGTGVSYAFLLANSRYGSNGNIDLNDESLRLVFLESAGELTSGDRWVDGMLNVAPWHVDGLAQPLPPEPRPEWIELPGEFLSGFIYPGVTNDKIKFRVEKDQVTIQMGILIDTSPDSSASPTGKIAFTLPEGFVADGDYRFIGGVLNPVTSESEFSTWDVRPNGDVVIFGTRTSFPAFVGGATNIYYIDA